MSVPKGAARRLGPTDIADAAEMIGVTEAHLRTVIEVETSGKGFDSRGRIAFLFEPHVFYKELGNTAKRKAAEEAGCAYPNWKGPGSYPKTTDLRWALFDKAYAIDPLKAMRSASWGLGQVMGYEYDEAGFTSVRAMLEAFAESEENQVIGMARLIKHRNLDKALLAEDWDAFALRYNGKAYKKNKYDTKLRNSYAKWKAKLANGPVGDEMSDGVLRMGESGERVRAMQKMLNDKGYFLKMDGAFGNRTRDMVLAWKADNSLPLEPKMTAEDLARLERSEHRPISEERANATAKDIKATAPIIKEAEIGKDIVKYGAGCVGAAEAIDKTGILDQVGEAVDQAQQYTGIFGTIKSIAIQLGINDFAKFVVDNRTLILLGLCVVSYFVYKRIVAKRVEMYRQGETP